MLVCPEESAEQRLNAREWVRLGAGRCAPRRALTRELLRDFLEQVAGPRAARC